MRRTVLSLASIAASFSLFVFSCDDWPPKGSPSGGGSVQTGTCSGTPLPCSSLTTLQCGTTPGCRDQGGCTGTPTEIGANCGSRSPVECNGTPGCFWQTNCTGTPYGTCSASTQDSCLIAPGCVWTPGTTVTGTGGAGGGLNSCQSYGIECTMTTTCDCGYTCVLRCPSCPGVCGTRCQTDGDCSAASAFGVATPFCQFGLVTNLTGTTSQSTTGICAVTK